VYRCREAELSLYKIEEVSVPSTDEVGQRLKTRKSRVRSLYTWKVARPESKNDLIVIGASR